MAYKSKFEATVAKALGKKAKYEAEVIHFVQPEKERFYRPDFKLKDGVFIEAKGLFSREDRAKHIWIREQHPELTIYMLFMNAFKTLDKRSKTTYADWCESNGIEWADFKMGIPKHWVQ